MHPLEENWRRHFEKTLLGRLRLQILAEITGAKDMSPDPFEVRLFLMSQRRKKTLLGQIYFALFHMRETKQVAWQSLELPNDFRWVMNKLERQPYHEAVFIEIKDCPGFWPNPVGVLIRCEELAVGGFVYSLVYLNEQSWKEKATLGYAEVRARRQDPDVCVEVFTGRGYIEYRDLSLNQHAGLAARLLTFLSVNSTFRPVGEVVASGAAFKGGFDGKDDPRFMELVKGVWRGEIHCSELKVPLNRVKPHDPAFALTFPMDVTKPVLAEIRAGNRPAMAVYWDLDRFVMCDDYPVYLAYRSRAEDRVPVIVLGEYPPEFGPANRVGGPELLPDLMIYPEPSEDDDDALDLALESRLRRYSARSGPVELYAVHAHLCELLADKKTTERQIHEFLATFPVVVDAYGASVRSEVRLGRRYRVDLVLQYPTADRRLLLVELEAPSKPLFTRTGRTQAPITHALQQVEDWLRWWLENPSMVPAGLERSVPPDGLVVAGRNSTLSDEERQCLVHLNQNRRVKLVTYDDLLDRLEEMIRKLDTE